MKISSTLALLILGFVWGLGFLLIRVAAPEFGPVALIEVRVLAAALLLVPVLVARGGIAEIRRHWAPIALLGLLHYALPFCLVAYAMLTLSTGFAAIINASSPLFAGVIAWTWIGERPQASRIIGLSLSPVGVAVLVWESSSGGSAASWLAVAAAAAASACYGLAAVLARRYLAGVSSTAVTAGSMAAAAILLLPLAVLWWPVALPSPGAWMMAILLGAVCTAAAFLLYFSLIAKIGPTRAITVTFLVPLYACGLGVLFLKEAVTASMLIGGAVIVLGTALSTGVVKFELPDRRNAGACAMTGSNSGSYVQVRT